MRRIILTFTVGLATAGLAAPSLASTTISTPPSAPVGVIVTVEDPIYSVPEDPTTGGSITAEPGDVTVETWGVPDPTAPEEPSDPAKEKDKNKSKDKDGKDKG